MLPGYCWDRSSLARTVAKEALVRWGCVATKASTVANRSLSRSKEEPRIDFTLANEAATA